MASPFLVDTAIFAYALGGAHAERQPSQDLLRAAAAGRVELHASVEMVQELAFHRMRRTDRGTAVMQAREAARVCQLHAFDADVLAGALHLIERSTSLGGRDAVHAATGLINGLSQIVSPDPAFDEVVGLQRMSARSVLAALEA